MFPTSRSLFDEAYSCQTLPITLCFCPRSGPERTSAAQHGDYSAGEPVGARVGANAAGRSCGNRRLPSAPASAHRQPLPG